MRACRRHAHAWSRVQLDDSSGKYKLNVDKGVTGTSLIKESEYVDLWMSS